jgi:predicted MFS family arabinose efflux permease
MTSITLPPRPAARPRAGHRIGHDAGFWAAAFAFLTVLAYNAVPAPLYSIYQQRDGFSSLTLTVIFSAYAVGVVLSLFTVGHLSDWHGRRRPFVVSLLLCIASGVVFLLWRDLPGLIVGRFIGGLGVGAVTATATAWLGELHAAARPGVSARRAQVVSTAANLGGIGVGPLVAGVLAQWVVDPLTIPYLVAIAAMVIGLAGVLSAPETREPARPRPAYRPQRVSVPAHARNRYVAAAVGAAMAFAVFGLFTSLAPAFLAGPLHHPSHALAGATAFAVFAAAVVSQSLLIRQTARTVMAGGIAVMIAGMAVLVISVWLSTPNLALFLAGGVITGAGAGALFKGVVTTIVAVSAPDSRAEALAGMFLAGYVGLTVPVVALGIMTQSLTLKLSLLIFASALAVGIMLAAPQLLGRAND